jgi:hypothetical protein
VGNVFFRFGASGLQELVEAEEFAAEGAAVGGPFGLASVDSEGSAGPPGCIESRGFSPVARDLFTPARVIPPALSEVEGNPRVFGG